MEFLQVFLALQGLEGRRRQLRDALAQAPKKVEAETARFQKEQAKYQEESARQRDLERKRGELETLKKTLDDRIARDKERMHNIRNNTEYQALLREIDHAEHDRAEADKLLATVHKELAAVDAALAEGQGGFEAAKARHEENLAAIEKERLERQADFDRMEGDRAAIATDLSPEHLQLYDRLAQSRGGMAVVPAQAGVCGGCHVKLRPALLSRLRVGKELIRCDSCSRVLYLPEAAPAGAKAG